MSAEGFKTYHLQHDTVTAAEAPEPALLARAVRNVVCGFADHFAYAAAAEAAAPRLSPGEVERRLRLNIDIDANPVAALALSVSGPEQFRHRWNAFNRLANLGVRTELGDGMARSARTAEPDTPFRKNLTGQYAELLAGRARRGLAEPRHPLRDLAESLGIHGGAADLIALLYDDAALDLGQCARQAGCSPRSLQRALSRLGLSFGLARQAVRLTIAGVRLRSIDEPVSRTAQEAGFFDAAHLNHAWRRSCAMTPAAYRSLARYPAG